MGPAIQANALFQLHKNGDAGHQPGSFYCAMQTIENSVKKLQRKLTRKKKRMACTRGSATNMPAIKERSRSEIRDGKSGGRIGHSALACICHK
jgi:hypothetical protein